MLTAKYRSILGLSRDFNLSYLQEIQGKDIVEITKPEWDLIINLYWKDDIDNAIFVKEEVINRVIDEIEVNFNLIY